MKLLHTSDWHLGRALYSKKRYDEFEAFLSWLTGVIVERDIDALIVAGDIFDTSTPSNRAQALYYEFLSDLKATNCRHIIIVAGNHDSPSFLDAPKGLLKALNVHVVGQASNDPADELVVLNDADGQAEMIICAVPYLRDRDIRTSEAGETIDDKGTKLVQGIKAHYQAVADLAVETRNALGAPIPIVATGHLFAAGGQVIEGDGVRDLYVGSLAHVDASVFPASFDYTALGHLHVPQKVGGFDHIRYCGSPLPMGFGEARQQKIALEVTFAGNTPAVTALNIPTFQKLEQISGNWETIENRLSELKTENPNCWLEISYEGDEIIADLRERLESATEDTELEILRVKNNRIMDRALTQSHEQETLDDLNEQDVFERCLEANEIPDEQRNSLRASYGEILTSLYDDDSQAE